MNKPTKTLLVEGGVEVKNPEYEPYIRGMREVVECIEKASNPMNTNMYGISLSRDWWQTKLKEWGLEERQGSEANQQASMPEEALTDEQVREKEEKLAKSFEPNGVRTPSSDLFRELANPEYRYHFIKADRKAQGEINALSLRKSTPGSPEYQELREKIVVSIQSHVNSTNWADELTAQILDLIREGSE